nr:MAG TPA: hydrogenase/urease nickel incorporation protein [Caudoviricetes sp.]
MELEKIRTAFLKGFQYFFGNIKSCDMDTLQQCVKQIDEALCKQIPKKPYYEGDGYDDNGRMIYDIWYCPRCEASYETDYEEHGYCPRCGQRIDWSEEDSEE